MPRKKNKPTDQMTQFSDILTGAMLLVVVAIMPLVVRAIMRPVSPEIAGILGAEHIADLFSYWKGIFIGLPAVVIALYWIGDAITNGKIPDVKQFVKRVPVVLSLVYLAFVIISALFSRYTLTSWWGVYDRSEGAIMWIIYFIVLLAAALYVRETKYAQVILYGLIFSSIFMGIIGTGQLLGYDFFHTRLGFIFVMGRNAPDTARMDTVFAIAHGTLFNPNTFGKYTAMISPVMLVAALTYDGKKYVNALFLIAGALMILSALGSGSLGGLVGIASAVMVLVITIIFRMIYRAKNLSETNVAEVESKTETKIIARVGFGAAGVVAILVFAVLFVAPINQRVTHLFHRMGVAIRAETATGYNYRFENKTMTVYLAGEKMYTLTLNDMESRDDNWLTIRDNSGAEVPLYQRQPARRDADGSITAPPQYVFNIPGYKAVSVQRFSAAILAEGFILTLSDGRMYGVWANNDDLIDLSIPVPAWGFYGRETMGSNRGYIWSRSFPLMPRRTIIGSGPDTFMSIFPIYDLIGAARSFGNPYTIVDKAHNIFIQTWLTTGGISAIALFALFGHYIFTTFVSIVKSKGEPLFSFGLRLGIFAGVSAFIMSGMFTDSTIGSTGVFFVLLGMGYGLNEAVKPTKQTDQ